MAGAIFSFEAASGPAVDQFIADLRRAMNAVDQAATAAGRARIDPTFATEAVEIATRRVVALRAEIERLGRAYAAGQIKNPGEHVRAATAGQEKILGAQLGQLAGRYSQDVRPKIEDAAKELHRSMIAQSRMALGEIANDLRGNRKRYARQAAEQISPRDLPAQPGQYAPRGAELYQIPLRPKGYTRTEEAEYRTKAKDRLERLQEEAQAVDADRQRAYFERMEAAGRTRKFGRGGDQLAVDDPARGLLFYKEAADGSMQLTRNTREHNRAARQLTAELQKQVGLMHQQIQATDRAPRNFVQGFVGGLTSRGFGRGSGFTEMFGGDPKTRAGARQQALTDLGTTAGNVAKYSSLYSALNAIQGAMRDTVVEAMDYADSLADLDVALGSTVDVSEQYVNTLTDIATLSGANVGAALDAAARGIRAFGDASAMSSQQIGEVGTSVADAATKVALIAGKDLKDATGDVIAIGSAFNLTGNQLNLVTDAIGGAKQKFGGDPKQIAQGLANVSITAREAGYNVAEAADMISLVVSRTDQSGQAAATRLSRIFSIISGTTGQNLGRQLGVDISGSIKEQIEQYARIYEDAGPELQGRIRSALGGSANMRELLPLLDPQAQAKFKEALTPGRGADEFQRKMETLVGTLKLIQGHIRALQVGLVRSDIFAPLGLAVRAAEPGLRTIVDLLNLYARLPGPIKTSTAALLEFSLALKAIQIMRGGAGIGSLLDLVAPRAGATGLATKPTMGTRLHGLVPGGGKDPFMSAAIEGYVAAINTGTAEITAANVARAAAEGRLNATVGGTAPLRAGAEITDAAGDAATSNIVAPTLGARQLRRPGGYRALAGTIARSPIARIGGGIAVAGAAFVATDTYLRGDKQVRDAARAPEKAYADIVRDRLSSSAEALQSSAQSLRSSAHELDRQQKGLIGTIFSSRRRGVMGELEGQAGVLEAQAQAVTQEQALAAAHRDVSVFGNAATRSVDDLAGGLLALTASGVSATEQAELYRKALTETPAATGPSILPEQTTATLANSVKAAIDSGALFDFDIPAPAYGTYGTVGTGGAPKVTMTAERMTGVQDTIRDYIASLDLAPGEMLDDAQKNQLTHNIIASLGIANWDQQTADVKRKVWIDARKLVDESVTGGKEGILPTSLFENPGQLHTWLFGDEEKKEPAGRARLQAGQAMIAKGDIGIERGNVFAQQIATLKAARIAAINNASQLFTSAEERKTAQLDVVEATMMFDELLAEQVENDLSVERRRSAKRLSLGRLGTKKTATRAATPFGGPAAPREQILAYNMRQELDAAAAGGSTKDIIDIIESYDQAVGGAVLSAVKDKAEADLKTANEALFAAGAGALIPKRLMDLLPKSWKKKLGGKNVGQAVTEQSAAQKTLDALIEALAEGVAGSAADVFTTGERSAAKARIAAAKTGNAVQAAKAATQTAKAALDKIRAQGGKEADVFAAEEAWEQAKRNQAETIAGEAANWAKVAVMRRGGDEIAMAKTALDAARKASAADPRSAEKAMAVIDAKQGVADATVARAVAGIQLRTVRVGGGIADAKGAIEIANIQVRAAGGRITASRLALIALEQGQEQMRNAMLDYAANLDLLKGDITDPVEQARDALADASRRVRSARNAGRGNDEIAALEVQQRQAAANLWRTEFNERMSDARIRYELGQMSFDAYMDFLAKEKRNLEAIKVRTYEQKQALYEVEQAIKGLADQFQGQFNLGDISLPTVYQVRRAAAGGDGANLPGQIQPIPYQVTVDVTSRAAQLLQIVAGAPTVNSTHLRK